MTCSIRLTWQFGITAILSAFLAFAVPVFVDRDEYTKAFEKYLRDPSADNEANMRAEGAKNGLIELTIRSGALAITFVSMNAVCLLASRLHRKLADKVTDRSE
jgi:hypothetical protein